jgi:RND family efflux transporter MFP subunit
MKKGIIYGLVAVLALSGIIWKLNTNKASNTEKTNIVKTSSVMDVPVQTQVVAISAFDQNVQANGNFEPKQDLAYKSETSGRIVKLMVKEGSQVGSGQVMAKVDDELLNADLQRAQASLDQARADVSRYETALKTGGVTQKQYDDSKITLQQMTASYNSARRRVQDTYIKAPISGVINKRYVEVGSYVTPGTAVFDIVDVSRLKLTVNVPEGQVILLKPGQSVNVTSNVYPEVNYVGTITFIASKGDNSLNYPVEIEVANIAGKPLKAGMYGTANFELPKQAPMMLVPRNAFVSGVNSNQVFVVENGVAKLRNVVAGRIFGDKVEIRDGLKEGEALIVSGQINLADGSKVIVQNGAAAKPAAAAAAPEAQAPAAK